MSELAWQGHEAAWREWRAALASPRLHHGWLLAGPQGLGKGHFARVAAAALVAEEGVPQPPLEAHPDILIPEHPPATREDEKKREEGLPYAKKRAIPVDEIRRLQHRLITRPTLGSRRVVILDPADDLETAAANALLKSLEEPPAGTYFLLVTHRPGRLLPTVRSRCRVLRFAPLGDAAVAAILAGAVPGADGATRAAAVAAAKGSPGAALSYVESGLGAAHGLMRAMLAEGDADLSRRGALAQELGARPAREVMQATLDLARAVLAGALRDAPKPAQARIIDAHGALVRLAAEAPTHNYDPGLLAMAIGALLAGCAMPKTAR